MKEQIADIAASERELLSRIMRYPAAFFGCARISAFKYFTCGHNAALVYLNEYSNHRLIPDGFNEYVAMQILGHDETVLDWSNLILQKEPDEEKALDMFFEILNQYLTENGYLPIEPYMPEIIPELPHS